MIIYIILIFIFLFLVFDLSTRKYIPTYTLEVYMGKKGAGKSTFATYLAIKYKKDGWNVYSNFYIPNTYLFDIEDFGTYEFKEHSLILCDEAGILFNNRDFKTLKPEVRNFLALQRKYSNKIVFFSQSYNVDKAIRDLADDIFTISKVFRVFTIVKRINKKIGIKNDGENGGQLIEEYKYVGFPKFIYIPRYTCLFDSFERPKMEEIQATFNELNEVQKKLLTTSGYLAYKVSSIFKFRSKKKVKKEDLKVVETIPVQENN